MSVIEIYNKEEWRPITERSVPNIVPDKYFVSCYGNVISYCRKKPHEMKYVPDSNPIPYYRVALLTQDGKRNYYLVHRIVLIEFAYVENYKELQANHYDGNKANNSIFNLYWATPSENIQHAYDMGLKTQYHGEDCPWCTVTNEQLEQIVKYIMEEKYTLQQIADMVGCSYNVVKGVTSGVEYKWLYDKYNLGIYKKIREK